MMQVLLRPYAEENVGWVRLPSRLRRTTACLALAAAAAAWSGGALALDPLRLEAVAATSGLTSEIVTAIHQDRAGFLWVGTREGLFRYDGYSATEFEHEVADPASLSDNSVRSIYEDREGRLWIGTNTGGLNRLDPASGTFVRYRHNSDDPRSLSYDSVYCMLEDRSGALWVGTQQGLNRFDPRTGTFERLLADSSNPLTPANDYIHALHEDRDGALWVATVGGGLNRRDPGTGRFTAYRHAPEDPTSIASDRVFAIAEDADGGLWVGTYEGLQLVVRETGTFRRFPHIAGDPERSGDPPVVSLAPGPARTLFVGTWGGGLSSLDIEAGVFRGASIARNGESGPTDSVACLHADRAGTVWVGTWGGGLNRIRATGVRFEVIGAAAAGAAGLNAADATAVLPARDGTLWIGTNGGGVNRRDATGFRYYDAGLEGASVRAIAEARDGTLWAGTSRGLGQLDPRSGALTLHEPGGPEGLGPGYVAAVLVDRGGRLWVGTGEGGLHRLRDDGRTFERFVHDPALPTSLSSDYVTSLLEDRQGTLWVGTRSGGLNACEPAALRCARFAPDSADPSSLGHHFVTAIHEDRDGRLWVATGGGGLNRCERDDQGVYRFVRITERDGLADDNVMGIAEDDDGSLWLSTRRGLTRFDPESGGVASYGVADGLPTMEFNSGAAASGPAGLYFGTPRGLVVVPRGTRFPSLEPSPTVLTAVRTLAGPLVAEAPIWRLERMRLAWGQPITFEFAVLDLEWEPRHRYTYRLLGLRNDWIDLGSRREITFADLSPGTYRLTVRGRNGHGVWSETEHALELRIVPPFWMTWWFRTAMLGTVALLALAVHYRRTSVLERRNAELLRIQTQREHALAQVRASEQALQEAYRELQDLTRRLEAAKEEERQRIARELHDEMGQVLSAIKINLVLLATGTAEAAHVQRVQDAVNLVDRMIRHVRELSLDLRPPLLDEMGLVAALRAYLEAQGRRSGIAMRLDANGDPRRLPPQIEIHLFRLVQEAVTNVIRHSEARSAQVSMTCAGPALEISIRDDGKGFDVDAILARAAQGHHLGLLGMRERVRSLGGDVAIESGPGGGTMIRIRVSLPS